MSGRVCHCGRPAMHTLWNATDGERGECCECHVKAGNPPADGHPECMRAYRERSEP